MITMRDNNVDVCLFNHATTIQTIIVSSCVQLGFLLAPRFSLGRPRTELCSCLQSCMAARPAVLVTTRLGSVHVDRCQVSCHCCTAVFIPGYLLDKQQPSLRPRNLQRVTPPPREFYRHHRCFIFFGLCVQMLLHDDRRLFEAGACR